jgi:uncharacterized protein
MQANPSQSGKNEIRATFDDEEWDVLHDLIESMQTEDGPGFGWDFCEGFMVGLLCTRRVIPVQEWLPVLFEGHDKASQARIDRFMHYWNWRLHDVVQALNQPVPSDGLPAYYPEVSEQRDIWLTLTPQERSDCEFSDLAPYGLWWAMGFESAEMHFEDDWDWPEPVNQALVEKQVLALGKIYRLMDDLDDTLEDCMINDDDGLPMGLSQQRFTQIDLAIDAVYELYRMKQALQGVKGADQAGKPKVGRNDPCPCGSGMKFKKCCAR